MPNNMGAQRRAAAAEAAAIAIAPISAAGGVLLNTMATVLQFSSQGFLREAEYACNSGTPNVVLGIEPLTRLFHAGVIDKPLWDEYAGYSGVKTADRPDGPTGSWNHFLWNRWLRYSRIVPPIDQMRKFRRQGRIEEAEWEEALKINGMAVRPWADFLLEDYDPLSIGDLWGAVCTGRLDLAGFAQQAALVNVRASDAEVVADNLAQRPGVADTLTLLNRGMINDVTANMYLQFAGYVDPGIRDLVSSMRFAYPTAGALLQSAGRRVWDDMIADRWTLDAEIPEQYLRWASKSGLDLGSMVDGLDPRQLGGKTWGEQLWREHWTMPSLGVMAQCMHRFRGDVSNPDTWSVPGIRPLTDDERNDIMQMNGVPPIFREYVQKLAFTPLSIRHVRILFEGNRMSKQWLQGKFRDMGMQATDAADLAIAYDNIREFKDAGEQRRIERKNKDRLLKAIEDAYLSGTINRQIADSMLNNFPLTQDDKNGILNVLDVQALQDVINAVRKRAKADYMSGRTSKAGAWDRLTGAGMDPNRARLIIQAWEAERGEGRVVLSMGKVLSLLRKGYIDRDEAVRRLDNLQVSKADEVLLLAEVEGEIAKDEAARRKAAEQSAKREATAMERLVAKNEARKHKLLKVLSDATPATEIIKWVREGLWDAGRAADRLAVLGKSPEWIEAEIGTALKSKAKASPTDKDRAEKIRGNLAKLYPPSRVLDLYYRGVWTREKAGDMLFRQGFTADSVEAQLADIDAKLRHQHGTPPAE